ncbi:hypothetical protein G6F15_005146 [Rhizopus arrhizus]|nr:hypothetical protein G6F15_005146 [Rhizopus arrhizus]
MKTVIYPKLKLNTVGLCVGAVFGTAAFTYFRSTLSQSIREFITNKSRNDNKPLEHLKLLNYQPRSISSITCTLPTNTIVFIGGLGDGLNAVPYLKPLETTLKSIGWSLTQVQLSSSVTGYGISSLQKDISELDKLIYYLTTKRGKKSILFLGHSTGCQDCFWHSKCGQYNQTILGYILQAPVSDREYMAKNFPHFQTTVELAISLKEQDKGTELLPRSAYPDVPITVDRFLSLAIKGGDDDVFSTDLTDQEIRTLYQNIHRPIYINPFVMPLKW